MDHELVLLLNLCETGLAVQIQNFGLDSADFCEVILERLDRFVEDRGDFTLGDFKRLRVLICSVPAAGLSAGAVFLSYFGQDQKDVRGLSEGTWRAGFSIEIDGQQTRKAVRFIRWRPGSAIELLDDPRLESDTTQNVIRDNPHDAVSPAVRLFELDPHFPRIQVKMREQMEAATEDLPPGTRAFGTIARLEYVLRLFDIRAEAFLELVSNITTQNAFMVLLESFARVSWLEYIGSPNVQPLSDELKVNLTTNREKIQQWTYKGYKRLESLRNSKLEHDAVKSASGDAGVPVRVDSESRHWEATGHQTGGAGMRAAEVTSAHLVLVEQHFMDWNMHSREEVEGKLKDLHCQDLTFAGRAFSALRIYEGDLVRTVTGHIAIYEGASHEFQNSEPVSRSQLDQFRERIMTSVRWSIRSLDEHLQRDKAASGDLYPLPNPHRYLILESNILDVVNNKLRMLEKNAAIVKSGSVPQHIDNKEFGDLDKRETPQTDSPRVSEWYTAQPESGTVVAERPMAFPARARRKRGRPVEIDTTTKEAALEVKARGGTGKEIAKVLYKTLIQPASE